MKLDPERMMRMTMRLLIENLTVDFEADLVFKVDNSRSDDNTGGSTAVNAKDSNLGGFTDSHHQSPAFFFLVFYWALSLRDKKKKK